MKQTTILVLGMLLFQSLVLTAATKVKESGTAFAKEVLAPYVESGELPGAISVFYKAGVQETCCIGYADVKAKRRITMKDIYMQCSQTKGFCGVTVAKLVEQGKVSLDDPIYKYIPEMKDLWVLDSDENGVRTLHKARNVLTLRMCLNHTGGFPFETSIKNNKLPGGGWSGGAVLRINCAAAAASPLLFEPGTKVKYSNTGIDVAAAVVEVVTGMKWEQYLKKEVLDPLGMKSTWFWPTDRQLKTAVEMYDVHKGKPATFRSQYSNQQKPYNDSHVVSSAGAGLWTNAEDQLKFYKMLMNLGVGDNGVRILKEETVKEILAKSSRPEGMEEYSLGLWVSKNKYGEQGWFGHGGALGTNCFVNCRTKSLRLWVVQLVGKPRPWDKEMDKAANAFFETVIDNSGREAYTGRIE